MEHKRQSVETPNHPVKRTKKEMETSMDDWLVHSKSIFDYTSNEILIIGPPSNFDDASFNDLSERLGMGDLKSCVALMKTLGGNVVGTKSHDLDN